ncbi:MAG: DOMON-like domain-containing protein [Azoarcus sp.]|nr:DOMON-like domain-containing protein [Azoarcus sp.]
MPQPSPAPKFPTITVGLRPFDSDEPPAVSSLLATIYALPSGAVHLEYALEGHIDALCIPQAEEPSQDPLWQHTCFEAFISVPEGEYYREYNFSPSGLWATGEFLHYRENITLLEGEKSITLPVGCKQSDTRLTLTAEVPPILLPASPILRVGLTAVVEYSDGHLGYWALHHPDDRPDFHHPGGWTLRLDTRQVTR